MANERLKRELIQGMQALKEIGAVKGATMRKFERELLGPQPVYSARRIIKLRERYDVSQAVFAALLNISLSTVQKWEQGQKEPGSAANKLLQVVDDYGLEVLISRGVKRAA